MGSIFKIWEKVLAILEQETAGVSYVTWIQSIKPLGETEDTIYFELLNDLHKTIINERYRQTIREAISKAADELNMSFAYEKREPVFLTAAESALLNISFLPETPAAGAQSAPVEPKGDFNTLNPHYTFDTFVVGNSNKFAHAACLGISEAPGHSYNPLFLYGGSGLGKTHLMHAIGNHIYSEKPNVNIMYVTSETFTNELVASIASNQPLIKEKFRTKYRSVDVLMIDDIQFIADKFGIQEELFHTFNTLYEAGRQIVISSDKPPKEIPKIEERLRSRFEWGLIADIMPPDFETKVAILLRKVEQIMIKESCDLPIDNEVLHFIASKSTSNIRQLEGSLQRVITSARLNNEPITIDLAERALKDFFTESSVKRISIKSIISVVCDYYDVSEEDIRSHKKNRAISYPRQIATYLMRDLTGMSFEKIGEYFGNSDHTTAVYAVKKISLEMKEDLSVKNLIRDLTERIREQ